MLLGFEKETKTLPKAVERKLRKGLVLGLNRRVGKENAITTRQIIEGFQASDAYKDVAHYLRPPVVRQLVHNIRINKEVIGLCSSSKGYYRAKNKLEYKKTIQSMEQRIQSMATVLAAMKEEYRYHYDEKI